MLNGQKFGRLTVQCFVGHNTWRCACECGVTKEVWGCDLKRGRVQSCGCLHREKSSARFTKHGMKGTPEYQAYHDARYRCTNPSHPKWNDYGGRGIKFLFTSFEQFFEHIGKRPDGTSRMSLDRKENDGNYELGNVRWATREVQRRNQREQKS